MPSTTDPADESSSSYRTLHPYPEQRLRVTEPEVGAQVRSESSSLGSVRGAARKERSTEPRIRARWYSLLCFTPIFRHGLPKRPLVLVHRTIVLFHILRSTCRSNAPAYSLSPYFGRRLTTVAPGTAWEGFPQILFTFGIASIPKALLNFDLLENPSHRARYEISCSPETSAAIALEVFPFSRSFRTRISSRGVTFMGPFGPRRSLRSATEPCCRYRPRSWLRYTGVTPKQSAICTAFNRPASASCTMTCRRDVTSDTKWLAIGVQPICTTSRSPARVTLKYGGTLNDDSFRARYASSMDQRIAKIAYILS